MSIPADSRHGRFSRTLSGIVWVAIAFNASRTVRGDDQTDGIQALWTQQKAEITSGRFEVILFRYFDRDEQRLDRVEAVRRLEALKPGADETAIEPIFDDLEALGWPKKKSFLWGTKIDVTIDGPKIANVTHTAHGNDVRSFNGTLEIDYRAANRQASITAGRSGIALVEMEEIRCIPVDFIDWKKTVAIESAEGRDAVLRSNGRMVRFDWDTGFVRRLTQSQGGAVSNETLQFDPIEVQGMTLPRITVQLRVQHEKIRMVSIYLIKSCRPNVAIDPSEFHVGVPTGTLIVDYRKNQKSPTLVRTPRDLEDATTFQAAAAR